MASIKDYVYQIKGNKISLLEKDFSTTDGLNYTYSGTSGDGLTDGVTTGSTVLKSPLEAVTDGIELEYTYRSDYVITAGSDEEGSKRYFTPLGYTSGTNNNLAFILPNYDFTASFGDSSNFTVGENILIKNSERWDGIHQIKYVYANGMIVTETDFQHNTITPYSTATIGCDFSATNRTITGNSDQDKESINDIFPAGTHYVFVGGQNPAADANNNAELFTATSNGAGVLTVTAKTEVVNGVITETANPTMSDESNDTVSLSPVWYDPMFLYQKSSFTSIDDFHEEFRLDLPNYLAKALVYYVKAKMAEEVMELDAKEYFMREFKRMIEKQASSNISGPRTVLAGKNSIR